MDIEYFKQKYGKGWLVKYNSLKNSSKYTKYNLRRKQHWNDFDHYREHVNQLTEGNKQNITNIHKRGFNSYHLDHKISIRYGFDNGIPAENISHESNLEMIYWKDNIRKSVACKVDDENKWILIEEGLDAVE